MDIEVKSSGDIDLEILHNDGYIEKRSFHNQVLRNGRIVLAAGLANQTGGSFQWYVTGVAFGDGGTVGGTPRFVDDTIEGLFGTTLITKPVIAQINPDIPYQALFTTVLLFDELVGDVVNEMGLQLADGSFFSVATFGDISKTSSMQLTWNWRLTFV